MIIKLAILDGSRDYMERLLDMCREKYADRLELSCFSDPVILAESLKRDHYDVLLVDENLEWPRENVPVEMVFALLTDEVYQEKDGVAAVCRYQRVEQLYREILGLYVDNNTQALKTADYLGEGAQILAVTSPSGGSGASTVAAALALALAAQRQRVTYLNLEPLGDPELYFHGEGRETLSEVVYAMKSNRGNLALRMESVIRKDPRGVRFFAAPSNPLERDEMTEEEVERLLSELRRSPENDIVVLDIPFAFRGASKAAFQAANRVIVVCGPAQAVTSKLGQLSLGLKTAQKEDLLNRMILLGNRGAEPDSVEGFRCLGTLPEYAGAGQERLLQVMAEHAVLRELI